MAMEQYGVLKCVIGEAAIERLVSVNKIAKTARDYVITDKDLLEEVLKKCLECSIDPKVLLVPSICKEDKLLYLVYYYIMIENYSLAGEVLAELKKKVSTQGVDLLMEALKKYPDKNEYILQEGIFKDSAVTEGFHKLERRLLINLDIGNIIESQKILDILIDCYRDVVYTSFFVNMNMMGTIGYRLSTDRTYQGNHDPQEYMGEPSIILSFLLESEDIYRAIEIIKKNCADDPDSIEWNIYNNTVNGLSLLLQKNSKSSQMQSIVNASVANSYEKVFSDTPYPSFTVSQLDEIEKFDIKKFKDKDFFSDYEDAFFKEHDYKKAKKHLLNFIKQEAINGMSTSYEYLMQELDKLILNEEAGVDLEEYNIAFDFALSYIDKEDYDSAIPYASRMASELKYSTWRAYSLLAICYANLGDIEKAAKWISASLREGAAPSFIEEYIDILYKAGKYEDVAYAAKQYETNSCEESVKIHYVFAAALLKQGLYDAAIVELDECTNILLEKYNMEIPFEEERHAIEESRKGNEISFTSDDYIDYTLDDTEEDLTEYIDESYHDAEKLLMKIDDDKDRESVDKKIEYLFSIVRILFFMEDSERGQNILHGIEPYLNEEKLPKENVKTYKRMLNNLKKA